MQEGKILGAAIRHGLTGLPPTHAAEIGYSDKAPVQSELSSEIKRIQMAGNELEMLVESLADQLGGLLMAGPESTEKLAQACASDPMFPRSHFGQEMRACSSRIETISMRLRGIREKLAV